MSASRHSDVLVLGGGLGGVAAALACASRGVTVTLVEETDWLGGQLSTQAVPPDEHPWIETHGCTRQYRRFRDLVRRFYKNHYPLTEKQATTAVLNPGLGNVSRLCHEPRVSNMVIGEMLSPWIASGKLTVIFRSSVVRVERSGSRLKSATFFNREDGENFEVSAGLFIDATELGDLLPLARIPYVTGSEGQDATGEMHTPGAAARPENTQAITWVAAVGFDPACEPNCDKYRIPEPVQYHFWKDYEPALSPAWAGKLLRWSYTNPVTLNPTTASLFSGQNGKGVALWPYRRILAAESFSGHGWHDVTVLNWPQNDYLKRGIIDVRKEELDTAYFEARQLTLSLIYWLQNDAPRPDGGEGYSGIYLRGDTTGTSDGLAKGPYVRESRRIRAYTTVTENEIGVIARDGHPPDKVTDSVGVGYYRIDLHPTTGGDNYIDIDCFPFQIPLGTLLSPEVDNFIAGAKNIGTTHVTNGCFRLHPVEWNIGEAAGSLAAFCATKGHSPGKIYSDEILLNDFQESLAQDGVELEWPRSSLRDHAERSNIKPALTKAS